jgi:hypothetical protein
VRSYYYLSLYTYSRHTHTHASRVRARRLVQWMTDGTGPDRRRHRATHRICITPIVVDDDVKSSALLAFVRRRACVDVVVVARLGTASYGGGG